MNTISAVFTVLTLLVLGVGWWAVNRKEPPPRRRQPGEPRR